MNKVMSNKWMIALYVLPSLMLVAILIFIPLVLTGYYGLTEWNGAGVMKFVGLENYAHALQDEQFRESVVHSFLLALFSTLTQLSHQENHSRFNT